MKAVVCDRYGPPEVLKIKELPKPEPKKDEVLVKIYASAVNSGDARIRGLRVKGFMRFVMRIMLGFTKPRKPVLGTVFSGVVEKVGEEVNKFKVGQEVYGATGLDQGCHSQYICVSQNKVITEKPKNASFEEAASLPFGGQTAIYFLRKGGIEKLEKPKVLIYGATGAVGTAAVQIAGNYNAEVTAVCSSRGKELAQHLGADKIVQYDKEDFTKTSDKFDIIFDAVGKTDKKQCAPLLKPDGKFLTVGGIDIADERAEYLEFLRQLYENSKYSAIIDKVYPMADVVEAHRFVDTERKKGNVVLKIV